MGMFDEDVDDEEKKRRKSMLKVHDFKNQRTSYHSPGEPGLVDQIKESRLSLEAQVDLDRQRRRRGK